MVSPTDTEDQNGPAKTGESSTSETDQVNTDSSDPKPSKDEPSTFDVVMNAIKKDDEDDDGSSSEEGKSDKSKDAKSKDKKDEEASDDDFEDFTPEERAALKRSTAERFDKLKGLYHTSKEENKTLKTQLEQATVEAGYYRQFVGFLEDNRLSQDEANQLFHVGALMKNDPLKALEIITPYYNELLHITGNILPPDLQQQVQQGRITKEAALELSRHRMTGQTTQAIQNDQRQHQQQRDTNRQQQNIAGMQTAIADWEKQWASSDPDYARKKDRVLDRVELLLVRAQRNGTLPKTVDEAVKLANQAKSEIEADFKQQKPRKQVRTVEGGGTTQSIPDAKDTADVIRRTLNQ